jgi:tryptophan halogenase
MEIVITGAGTAGWLAALFISRNNPAHNVTVVASKTMGVIGAGEAVTGMLTDLIGGRYGDFGIDPVDFIKKTAAMPKYGIFHKNWTSKKDFNYFAPIDGTLTANDFEDPLLRYLYVNYPDKMHLGTWYGQLYENNISPINMTNNNVEITGCAWHFDAMLVAKYLEELCLSADNCSMINAKILDINLTENGHIKSLLLDNQATIEGDFFIDASGFSRLLTTKLGTKWISYKKHLPVNAALPFFLNYDEGESPNCYSTAWAQSSGWIWEANIQTRKGCGYTFCDDFITADQAHQEIETVLGRKVTPIKHIKFDTGRLENTWVGNCLAVGLAASFAEPLEATSIHSTIVQLIHFSFEFLKDNIEDTTNPASIKIYNNRINTMFEDFKDFLVCHYLGGRTDSEFWKYITAGNTLTEFTRDLKEMCKSRIPTMNDFPSYVGAATWPIWSFILTNTGQISTELARRSTTHYTIHRSIDELNRMEANMERLKTTHYPYSDFREALQKSGQYIPFRGAGHYL